MNRTFVLLGIVAVSVAAWIYLDPPAPREVMAYEFQPPAAKTGAPAEGTCIDCHGGSLLNEAGGSVSIGGIPNSYVPTQTYTITVTVRHPTQHRWGFELVPLTTNNMMAGVFTNTTLFTDVQVLNGKTYMGHTNQRGAEGTFPAQPDSATWTFSWTAPGASAGTVTFYAAGNAANNNNLNTGDKIYTTSISATEGSMTGVDATTWGKIKMLYR